MYQNNRRNQFKRRHPLSSSNDREFRSTGYYMWDMENGIAYPRTSYAAAVCTAVAANKKRGKRTYFGVYFEKNRCFNMLDFVDGKFPQNQ